MYPVYLVGTVLAWILCGLVSFKIIAGDDEEDFLTFILLWPFIIVMLGAMLVTLLTLAFYDWITGSRRAG